MLNSQVFSSIASHYDSAWLRTYVRLKFAGDPVYGAALARFKESDDPILDIGCGVGLLAFYLRQHGLQQPIVGIDSDVAKLGQASRIAAAQYRDISFRVQDARARLSGFCGNVAMLDVLHYFDDDDQTQLLVNAAEYVKPGGIVVIRDCPRDSSWRFKATYLEEAFAKAVRWLKVERLNFATRDMIRGQFRARNFSEEIVPLWGKTPFNNHLFVFRRPITNGG